MIYNQWKKYLHESIELCPIELAGRGMRSKDDFYTSFEEVIDDVYDWIDKNIDDYQYSIFGHSMGSTIAYEVCCKITELNKKKPVSIYLSGRGHPDISINSIKFNLMENREFMDEIIKLGGIPEEYKNSKVLINYVLPIIKSDFKILENYTHSSKESKLDIKFNVFYGKQDSITNINDMQLWNIYTKQQCNFFEFEGNHFFINENMSEVVSAINESLISEI